MRPVLACLTAGALAVALASATPASAEPADPTFDPSPVVLSSGPQPVSGAVQLEEADGLTLESARVYDPGCALSWDSLPVDPDCPVWLAERDTSKVGDVRSVTLAGAIPLLDSHGTPVDRPTTYVTLVYTDGSHAYLETGLNVYGGYRVSLVAPDGLQPGDSLKMTSRAEHYAQAWLPDPGLEARLQHLSTSSVWETLDKRTTDATGEVTFAAQRFGEAGDWRVVLTEAASTVDAPLVRYSRVTHVGVSAPPTPPVVTPPVVTPPKPPVVTSPATRPSRPRRQHTRVFPGRAVLYWAAPASTGGARIDRYQVRRGTSSFARNLRPGVRHFTFTHLRNGSLYRLYVRAHNARGFGGWVAARARPQALPRPRDYAGCAALHRVYPHGVGRPGARDRGGHVTTFTRSLATYRLNTEDDRDRDGIACERR